MTAVTAGGPPNGAHQAPPDGEPGGADGAERGRPDDGRRAALRALSRGLAATCLGGLVGGLAPTLLAGTPVAAAGRRRDVALDIQMLQTASSLETLLVDLYGAALGTGPQGMAAPSASGIADMVSPVAQGTLRTILTETQAQHREHRLAFQTLTLALGGREQHEPNPKYLSGVAAADVSSPLRLVDYAALLEKILTDTYIVDLTLAENVRAKETIAAVMAVEAQHVALLRAVGELLRDGTPELVKIPIGADLGNLPPTLAAIAFPEAMEDITASAVAEPESGAVP
jgi:hypothetical protein